MAEFNEPTFRALPSHTSQQIIRNLFKNISSWQKSRKEYVKNPNKFSGRPKLPKYKNELSELYFTSIQLRLKDGFVRFPQMMCIEPIKTNIKNIQFGRVIPKSNHFVVELIYNIDEVEQKEYNGNWLSIDMGLNNLATCVSNVGSAFIINGKPIKSINNFYNKRKKQLQSKLKNDIYTSRRIERLTYRRNNKIKDYIHKSSKYIVNFSKERNITKIIFGNNKNWKQNINLGKNNNRDFTNIPHATLIDKTRYKAKMIGIKQVETQEAYTSKCSALDLEPIKKHEQYVGKRVKRGLFRTSKNQYINADCNGSLNIARLVNGDIIVKDFESILSVAVTPYKVKTFV
jgi:putative transposase